MPKKVYKIKDELVFFITAEYENNLNLAVVEYDAETFEENDVITTNFEFLSDRTLGYVEKEKAVIYEKLGLLKRTGKSKPSGFNLYELCSFDKKKMYSSLNEAVVDFKQVGDV